MNNSFASSRRTARLKLGTGFIQLLLIAMMPATLGAAPKWKPDAAIIQKLESSITIPKQNYGHKPVLSDYARFYVGYIEGGHRMIHAELVLADDPGTKPAGVYIVDDEKKLPMIADGGCAIVNLVYNVETARIISLQCNGRA